MRWIIELITITLTCINLVLVPSSSNEFVSFQIDLVAGIQAQRENPFDHVNKRKIDLTNIFFLCWSHEESVSIYLFIFYYHTSPYIWSFFLDSFTFLGSIPIYWIFHGMVVVVPFPAKG